MPQNSSCFAIVASAASTLQATVVILAHALQELVEALKVQRLDEVVAGSELDGLHGGIDRSHSRT